MSLPKTRTALYTGLGIVVTIIVMIAVFKPVWTIASDGFGYYEYLRSAVFDKDLNFHNEGNFFASEFHIQENNFYTVPTVTGYYPNPFAIGTAVFEVPWFLAAHAYHHIAHYPDSSLPGFSADYAFFLYAGNICYGLAGLLVTYLFIKKITSQNSALLASVAILFGTGLVYFVIYESIWSHLLAFLCVSAFVYYWYETKDAAPSVRRGIILGLLLGLNFLVRWQNVALVIFLVPDAYRLAKQFTPMAFKQVIATGVTFFVSAVPQLLVWKLIYGQFIVKPYSNSPLIHLASPPVFNFLFSPLHGMFVWHPLYIVAFVGLAYFAKKNPRVGWLFIAFLIVEIYINSAVADWWGGGGGTFGARRMLDYSLLYAVGVAWILQWAASARLARRLLLFVLAALVIINVSLMLQAARGWLDLVNPENGSLGLAVPSPATFVVNSKRLALEFLRIR